MEQLYKLYCDETFDDNGVLQDIRLHCPDNFNFGYDVVDRLAAEHPDKKALIWCDVNRNHGELSFKQMSEYSNMAANVLTDNGIKKGDKVMVILKRHYEYWYTVIALHKIGAIVIPATHMLSYADIEYRINSADIKAVVCTSDGDIADKVKKVQENCDSLEKIFNVRADIEGFTRINEKDESVPKTFKRIETHVAEPFMMYFTSGTTGMPKAVIHDHTYPLAHISTAVHWHNVKNNGLHLTVADTGWGKASWGKLYGQWLAGCTVMVYEYEKFVGEEILQIISDYKVTSFCAPPTIYRVLVKIDFSSYDLSSLEYVTSAGEAINPIVLERFEELTGLKVREGYGQTESTLMIANLINTEPKFGSMGKPTPLYDIRIVDDAGNETDCGEIVVVPDDENRNFGLFKGYDKDFELYKKAWRGGVYHTGDIARRDEDGYFWYVCRKDDIIKSSGYRISPHEVEDVIMKHECVLECAVNGVPDEIRGIAVKATIVLCDGYEASDSLAREIQSFVKGNTAPYKYPRIIEFVKELPKTISGKTRRIELK